MVGGVSIVEKVGTLFKVFDHLSGCELSLKQAIYTSTVEQVNKMYICNIIARMLSLVCTAPHTHYEWKSMVLLAALNGLLS